MPGKRRHDEHGRLVAGPFLAEMQELAERMRGNDLFGDRDLLAVDVTLRMPKSGRSCDIPALDSSSIAAAALRTSGAFSDQRPWLGQHAAEKLGHQANRGEYVAVCLVGVVKHISS